MGDEYEVCTAAQETYAVHAALLTCAAVACQDLCTGALHHLGILDRLLHGREDAEFCCDGDAEVCMKDIDWEYDQNFVG